MKIKMLLIIATFTIFSTIAAAGEVRSVPVVVDTDNMVAEGDMWTARNSKNDVEFIGCGIRNIDDGVGGVFTFGFCQAQDAEENTIFCFTENDDLLVAMSAISDYSFITFAWDENDECISIGNSTQSWYLPKLKTK